MIETQQYIRKPLYVDAVRVTTANFDEIAAWCQGEIQQDEVPGQGTRKKYIKVRVHNPKNPRQTKAFVGDWLLYTERGYKVYTNKAFHASFDAAVPTPEAMTPEESVKMQLPVDNSPEHKAAIQKLVERERQESNGTAHESLAMSEAIAAIEADGGTVEVATPEGIAEAVSQNEEARFSKEDLEGKRVLSLEEQEKMTQEELKELLRSGEVVLAQDLTA